MGDKEDKTMETVIVKSSARFMLVFPESYEDKRTSAITETFAKWLKGPSGSVLNMPADVRVIRWEIEE